MKGLVTIEVRNKDTLELEDTIVKENIITRHMLFSMYNWHTLNFGIAVTNAVWEPSIYAPPAPHTAFAGMVAINKSSDIPNVPACKFFASTDTSNAFFQYAARFNPPDVGSSRTISTVMLLSTSNYLRGGYDHGFYYEHNIPRAYAKLSVPCIQTDTQVFDIYYRVFFEYDEISNIPPHIYQTFLTRFGLSGDNYTSFTKTAVNQIQHTPWPLVQIRESERSSTFIETIYSVNDFNVNRASCTPVRTATGLKSDYIVDFNEQVGNIISGAYYTDDSNTRLPMALVDYRGKFNKIQNLIGGKIELKTNVTPFLNVDNLPDSTGKVTVTGEWANIEPTNNRDLYYTTKFPEWNKIQIVESGNVGVSKYTYTTQAFIGFQGSFVADRINLHRPIPVVGLGGRNDGIVSPGASILGDVSDSVLGPEQMSAVTSYDSTSVVIPKKNALILYSLSASEYWRITGDFIDIHQLAVVDGVIYIACRSTGLWKVNPRVTLAAQKVDISTPRTVDFSKCHGVAEGFNKTVWAVANDALVCFDGNAWAVYDSTTDHKFGEDTTIFSNIEYIKVDTKSPNNELMVINRRNNVTTNLGWWWSTASALTITGTQPTLAGFGRPRVHRGHVIPCNGKWMVISNYSSAYISNFGTTTFTQLPGNDYNSTYRLQGYRHKCYFWESTPDNTYAFYRDYNTTYVSSNSYYDSSKYGTSYGLLSPVSELTNADGTAYRSITPANNSLAYYGADYYIKSSTASEYDFQGYVVLGNGLAFTWCKFSDDTVASFVHQYGLAANPHGGDMRWLAMREYGWDGSKWVKGGSVGRPTHATEEPLFDGIKVKFENGAVGTSFMAPNYWKFGLCDGVLKDNASRVRFATPFYYTRNLTGDVQLSDSTVPTSRSPGIGAVGINYNKSSANVRLNGQGFIEFPGNNRFQYAVGDKQVTGDFELSIDVSTMTSVLQKDRVIVGVGKIHKSLDMLMGMYLRYDNRLVVIARRPDGSMASDYIVDFAGITTVSIKRVAGVMTCVINGATAYTLPAGYHRPGDSRLDIVSHIGYGFDAVPENCFAPKLTLISNGSDNAVMLGAAAAKTESFDIRFIGVDNTVTPKGTINGVMAPVKTDGTLPAPGEITLDCESGIAYFNEADVGKPITLNCTRVFFS